MRNLFNVSTHRGIIIPVIYADNDAILMLVRILYASTFFFSLNSKKEYSDPVTERWEDKGTDELKCPQTLRKMTPLNHATTQCSLEL